MNDDKWSGLALIAGSVGMIITMSLHPTGHDLFVPGRIEAVAVLTKTTHGLALVSLPVVFLGAMGLARRLGWNERASVAALVLYGFALVAVMNAAVASGLVAPEIGRRIVEGDAAAGEVWRMAFRYNGMVNQGFAMVFVVASSMAILLWSAMMVRSGAFGRRVGIYGCIVGPLTVLAVLSGHVRLDVHGFGAIVMGQAIWYVAAGAALWRAASNDPEGIAMAKA
jgi:hypothetical protein